MATAARSLLARLLACLLSTDEPDAWQLGLIDDLPVLEMGMEGHLPPDQE